VELGSTTPRIRLEIAENPTLQKPFIRHQAPGVSN